MCKVVIQEEDLIRGFRKLQKKLPALCAFVASGFPVSLHYIKAATERIQEIADR
jgi:hypothetical protein